MRAKGILTIKQDGIMKVLLGHTTMSELERMTEGTRLVGGSIDEVDDRDFEENQEA